MKIILNLWKYGGQFISTILESINLFKPNLSNNQFGLTGTAHCQMPLGV